MYLIWAKGLALKVFCFFKSQNMRIGRKIILAYYFYFTDKVTEGQRGKLLALGHSELVEFPTF
jgi:hypothetical protein